MTVSGTGRSPAAALSVELRGALRRVAREPRLLVASDYDGTIAPIVLDPDQARPRPDSVRALRVLADLPETTTAVISGRALRDLATLSRLPAEVRLVGSHGSEFDIGFVHALSEHSRRLLDRVYDALVAVVANTPGVRLEAKPASVAVHLRQADPAVADRVLADVRSGPATWGGVWVTEGKAVIELAVIPTDKGDALESLRRQVGATAAVFLGDDVTDERVFNRLAGPDVGIHVGGGDTRAQFRVTDNEAVAAALAFLVEERRDWLYGESAVPIERLSMLANETSVALLTPDARLTWMCHPEPDSAAVFADLVGGPSAGHFSIGPARTSPPLGQRYLPGTMTVQTRWSQLLVTDYLAPASPAHRTDLVRVGVRVDARSGDLRAPARILDRSLITLRAEPNGLRVLGTGDPMVLGRPGLAWEMISDGRHDTAQAVVDVTPDRPVSLTLRCGSSDLTPCAGETDLRARAGDYWSDWSAGLTLPSVRTEPRRTVRADPARLVPC